MPKRRSLAAQSLALEKRLEAIPAEITRELRPALIAGAHDTADMMETLVPEDSGDLQNTIAVTPPGGTTPAYSAGGGSTTLSENQAAVTVGSPDVRYAHIVEFGSVKMEAKPFMLPGMRIARPKAQRRITTAINKAIRNAGKGKA